MNLQDPITGVALLLIGAAIFAFLFSNWIIEHSK